ncbi:MAG: efflux RND transporter permease subunit, partial [Gammaproteobacteria bacterium]|nr:efflux RND transporter permease subunit [Gammaproteobacteria bacterium]
MLDAIVRFAVTRRGIVLTLALLLSFYGLYRITLSSLDIFPEFAGKRIVVQTEAPGLAAELVENLVTFPVERALAGLVGLQHLRSESIHGLSVIVAVFDDATELYRDRQLVGERLATVSGQLPLGAGPPILVPLASSSATIMTLGLTSADRSPMELSDLVQWTLAPRLLAVPGVADVNVFGAEQKQLQIQIDPEKLWRYGIGINGLERGARQVASPAGLGFIENTNQRLGLQLSSGADVARSLGHIVLLRSPQGNVTLSDIARIGIAPKPRFSAAQVGGEPAVLLMVIGQHGANTLRVSRLLDGVLDEFKPLLARQGIDLHPRLFRPADYIELSVRNLAGHLAIGAVLVIAVLAAFLFDLRAAAIAALAIPLSLLGAITVLLDAGINLNIMVLGGLTIALGEVVDDAIIDTENIFRRLRENRGAVQPLPNWRVVYQASLEVRSSVVYASFIIALVFVPLLTFGGVAGRLFAPLGYTYILAVLMSLLIALTVTPALCYLLLDPKQLNDRPPPLIRGLRSIY